jgi:DUF971 family protein
MKGKSQVREGRGQGAWSDRIRFGDFGVKIRALEQSGIASVKISLKDFDMPPRV